MNRRINKSDSGSPRGNAVYINKLNKIEVLGLIREHGSISRAEIVEVTGLSAPTVSRIVKGLTREEKLVESIGIGDSSGGRPPLMLRFRGELSYVIGIDLGATTTRGVLSDLNGIFIEEIEFPTRLKEGFDVIVQHKDPKTQKIKTVEGRLFARDDLFTVINIKGRMKKLKNSNVISVKLPKAKKEKGAR